MISGLMILKDGIELGYPFVEAITQVIPYVDEFVVVECGSSDKTMKILIKLVSKYIDKLRVAIHPWDFSGINGEKIGEIQTIANKYCKGDHILLVQADEIWDKESVEFAVTLPKSYPLVGLFKFPFNHIVGNASIKQTSYDSAVRMYKNDHRIASEADGWTVAGTMPHLSIDLPTPITHTGSIGWRSSYGKIVHHSKLYKDNKLYQTNAKEYKKRLDENNPESFYLSKHPKYESEVPQIIKPLLGIEKYYVREELL